MIETLHILLGLTALFAGAELVVRGASALATRVRVPPLVIGLTVVAYGTSTPELGVSLNAAYSGQADIALGNAIGSNIFNVMLILGVCALIVPLKVSQRLIQIDVPVLIGISLLLALLAANRAIGPVEGIVLLGGLIIYTALAVVHGSREHAVAIGNQPSEESVQRPAGSILLQIGITVAGLALLLIGSRLFTGAAVDTARALGLSELVIALTIVAAGTSLPEVAASIMAAVRGNGDIAVGNVVGSNLFNILGVVGASSIVAPAGVAVTDVALRLDIPVMIAASIACLPVFFTGHRIDRWEGALFLVYFAAYVAYRIVAEVGPERAPSLLAALCFVLPPIILTVAIGIRRWATIARSS